MAITLLWLAAAVVAAFRAKRLGGAARIALVFGAVLLASLHGFGWNKPIYFAGRELLAEWGVYGQRFSFKVAIGVVFFGLVVWTFFCARRLCARLTKWERLAFAAMSLDGIYIAVRTCSVDGWMPDVIAYEPGKSVLGVMLATLTLLALLLGSLPNKGAAPRKEFYVTR
ncbi:MAG: hypothetical protein ABIP94_17015 [Planctomycetota bacterium]